MSKPSEHGLKQFLPIPYKRKRFYTPYDVSLHNIANDLWVSFFGKVWDLTNLIQGNINSKLCEPIIKVAGKDITYWFIETTREPRRYIDY
jgi:hypothetical protein